MRFTDLLEEWLDEVVTDDGEMADDCDPRCRQVSGPPIHPDRSSYYLGSHYVQLGQQFNV